MGKFDAIIEKYNQNGIDEIHIEYAVSAVKDGTKREFILENLTSDYRKVAPPQAVSLLEDLYVANGGEFKKENRNGYWYAALFLIIGVGCSYYIFYVFTYGGIIVKPVLVFAGAIAGTLGGLFNLIRSISGKYRDDN